MKPPPRVVAHAVAWRRPPRRASGLGTRAASALAPVGLLLSMLLAPGPSWAEPALVVRPSPADAPVLAPGWRRVGLPGGRVPLTRYEAAVVDGRDVLKLEAEGSYGHLVQARDIGLPMPTRVAWRWRVDQLNPRADLSRKDGDDSPVKLCMAFELPIDRVPFVERQLLRLASMASGEALPTATLCWLWDARLPAGTVRANIYTPRMRYVVVRGAGSPEGRWFDEERDVEVDLRRAFGDELPAGPLPPVSAVIVSADADNTGGRSRALLADLVVGP